MKGTHHHYHEFKYIYSLLIENNIYDHRKISIKLLCVCVCLSSGDLHFFCKSFPCFSYLCVICTLVHSFSTWSSSKFSFYHYKALNQQTQRDISSIILKVQLTIAWTSITVVLSSNLGFFFLFLS